MGTRIIYKFIATILPLKYPSSLNVTLILFMSRTILFWAIWLGFGWEAPLIQSSSTAKQYPTRSVILVSTSTRASIWLITFPGYQRGLAFSNSSISIYPSVAHYQIFEHLVRWLWLLSIIATDFLVENHAKCLISSLSGESEKVPCRTALTFLQKLRSRFASLLTHACVDLLHPIWYLTPVSNIPGRTYAHLRSAAVGMLKYPGICRSQLDPGNFAISSPSAWNFLQVDDLRDPGFSLITLRWNLAAFLSSLFLCSSNALHYVYVFKLPAAFVWDNF